MKSKILLFLFLFFVGVNPLNGFLAKLNIEKSATNKETDLAMIDSQIKSLENLKAHYLAKASRIRNLGDRLQFSASKDHLLSAQKSWKTADEYDKLADQIQVNINNLKNEKTLVLKMSDY